METSAMESPIVNRVAGSGIITIDLADLRPEGKRSSIDLRDRLFMGMVLREKDFREWVENHPWEEYSGHHVCVYCTADAIIPAWAYMIIAVKLAPVAASVHLGSPESMEAELFGDAIRKYPFETLSGKKVCIKGCGEIPVPESAYLQFSVQLSKYAEKIMYGEPCSSVPVYRTSKPTR